MGKTLIDEVPEAQRFISTACRSWEKYKRFPLEDFTDVRGAVLATSGIDSQNEAFAPEGLYESAKKIGDHSLWLTAVRVKLARRITSLAASVI